MCNYGSEIEHFKEVFDSKKISRLKRSRKTFVHAFKSINRIQFFFITNSLPLFSFSQRRFIVCFQCRNRPEKVHCISCDRPLEVQPGETGPNMPKMKSLPVQKSTKPYTTFELEHIRQHQKMNAGKKPPLIGADFGYQAQKLKNEVTSMTGLVDMVDLPPSQRYCGGSHTIMHPYRRSFKAGGSHFNQYVVIREDSEASVPLPRRDFIVPRDNNLRRYTKPKLPAIGRLKTHEGSPPPEYIAEFAERPLSAPATPSVDQRSQRHLNPPEALDDSVNQSPSQNEASSPTEMEKITVAIPSPGDEP